MRPMFVVVTAALLIAQSGAGLAQMTAVEQTLADKINAMNGRKTEMEAGSANPLLKLAPIRSAIRPLLLGSGRWMERTLAWF